MKVFLFIHVREPGVNMQLLKQLSTQILIASAFATFCLVTFAPTSEAHNARGATKHATILTDLVCRSMALYPLADHEGTFHYCNGFHNDLCRQTGRRYRCRALIFLVARGKLSSIVCEAKIPIVFYRGKYRQSGVVFWTQSCRMGIPA